MIKRLAILLLFAFSWQSIAAPILDCCDESMPTHDSAGISAHQQMHAMTMADNPEDPESMNHAAHPGASADCNCDCICEYCVVSTTAMLENTMQLFTVLTGPLSFRFNFGPSFPIPENPFRPPVFA